MAKVMLKIGAVVACLVLLLGFLLDVEMDTPPARTSHCLSNLKILSAGLQMYVEDYDGSLPPAPEWRQALPNYVKSNGAFVCPSDERPDRHEVGSYSFNGYLHQTMLERVVEPASVPVLFDGTPSRTSWLSRGEDYAKRHFDRGNVAYADGHAATVSKSTQLSFKPRLKQLAGKGRPR